MGSGNKKLGLNIGDARGFTMIELMLAMVIMTAGLFSIIQMQLVAIRGNNYSKERTEAQMIAQGVAEELRAKALEWIEGHSGAPKDFTDVFKSNTAYQISLIDPPPAPTDSILATSLRSIVSYRGQTISNDGQFASALAINLHGKAAGGTTLESAGAIYRVHYIAHRMSAVQTDPQFNLVRITLFVSWDSKDFGEQQSGGTQLDWNSAWQNTANFWMRPMVSLTLFLNQTKAM